ncbi:MAG: metallophosphoesterase [Clostridia bacterium]|nr:metallophosphoesterase [Clostridia bacterium]
MYSLLVRIMATLLATLFSLFNISADIPGFSENKAVKAEIDFVNEEAGSADAVISIETTADGEYKLFWADEDFEKLTVTLGDSEFLYSEFASITTYFGEGSLDLPDYTAIPDNAKNILLESDGELLEIIPIPEEKTVDRENKIYSFGSISDLHFNRYDLGDGNDVAQLSFDRALSFFNTADVALVAMPGDISTDGEKEAFMSFNEISSKYDFPVYTTTGNHDLRSKYEKENWLEYMNTGAYGEEKANGIIDVAENGMDFVYEEPASGDIFIFLNQTSNGYGQLINALLQNSQLDWLEAQLEEHKDKSVYLFFHTFLTSAKGNPLMSTGNLYNSLGWAYPLFYTPGANDEICLRELLREYDNVFFFNGHSHWAYHMQSLNPNLNISKNGEDGATFVHVSSVSSPRVTGDYQVLWSGTDPNMSEGYLIEVYEDTLLLMGVDFVNGTVLAYATYECER